MSERDDTSSKSRRDFIAGSARWAAILSVGGPLAALCAQRAHGAHAAAHWQIDPDKCTQCGKCATQCVLTPSAVKCTHAFGLCGYCDLCTGFFQAEPNALNTGAENQLCPTAALKRRYVEDPYYEYTVESDLCIGCAKCVKGCSTFGNGSLQLQIDQKRCAHCNRCSIAAICPPQAISRVPADRPYIIKTRTRND